MYTFFFYLFAALSRYDNVILLKKKSVKSLVKFKLHTRTEFFLNIAKKKSTNNMYIYSYISFNIQQFYFVCF